MKPLLSHSARRSRCTRSADVSVLMTVFNTAQYLREAIDSVLAQSTSRTWELLIVDDGSTDDSLSIANEYATRFPHCICTLRHRHGENRGISASRNLALQHARAPLISFLDSDDVWLPHRLEVHCDLLNRHPEIAMVYAGAERWIDFAVTFDEQQARSGWWGSNYLPPLVPVGEATGLLAKGQLVRWFLQDESMVPCICTVLMRTAAARSVGGFQDEFHGLYDDQVFHAKVSMHHRIYAHDVCVARYRQHQDSCCAVGNRSGVAREVEGRRFLAFLQQHLAVHATTVEQKSLALVRSASLGDSSV